MTAGFVCTEGPRFETPAEIRMFAKLGGDLVGMTNVPEVVLAREAGICYATISMVTNYAAGMATGPLTHEEVVALMQENTQRLRQVIVAVLKTLPKAQNCSCQSAVPNGDLCLGGLLWRSLFTMRWEDRHCACGPDQTTAGGSLSGVP